MAEKCGSLEKNFSLGEVKKPVDYFSKLRRREDRINLKSKLIFGVYNASSYIRGT